MRAMAIMQPGMFLSQPPTASTPSIIWPLTDTSMASAITSRDTSEYFIPSVPMPMPSVTVGKPNTCGIAPASLRAAMARSTSGWMPALQGFMVEWPLATPTIGLSKSWSLKPTARSMARFGERATPPVMRWERQFSFLVMGFLPQGAFLARREVSSVVDGSPGRQVGWGRPPDPWPRCCRYCSSAFARGLPPVPPTPPTMPARVRQARGCLLRNQGGPRVDA